MYSDCITHMHTHAHTIYIYIVNNLILITTAVITDVILSDLLVITQKILK